MTAEHGGPHIAPDTLADYYGQSLSEDEEMRVEEHLMGCPSCTDAAHAMHRLAHGLDSWTATSHGAAARAEANAALSMREIVARGIRAAQAHLQDQALGERLARWARRWEEQARAAAVRVAVDGPGSAARMVAEGLDALTRPGSNWQLAPAATPIRGTLGVPEPTELTLALGPGAARARIEVNGNRGDIVVRLESLPRGQQPPLVLLVDVRGDAPPAVAVPSAEPGIPYLLAHFRGVVPGEYVVAIESGT